jgi:hypothetical protein
MGDSVGDASASRALYWWRGIAAKLAHSDEAATSHEREVVFAGNYFVAEA